MRHVKLNTLYPFIELVCPVCDEESDHPVDEVDCEHPWNDEFHRPICHCGHKYSMIEVRQRGVIYG